MIVGRPLINLINVSEVDGKAVAVLAFARIERDDSIGPLGASARTVEVLFTSVGEAGTSHAHIIAVTVTSPERSPRRSLAVAGGAPRLPVGVRPV